MTTRPNVDAVRQWLDGGDPAAELRWSRDWLDPPEWDDYLQRIEAAIRSCSSGVAAYATLSASVEELPSGRRLPHPRTKRKSKGAALTPKEAR